MNEIFTILLIFLLSIIQTVAGVGLLLLGTPILLLNGFSIISTINTLLPFSILTSLLNLFFIGLKEKKSNIVREKDIVKIFFLYCLPGVLIGIIVSINSCTLFYFLYSHTPTSIHFNVSLQRWHRKPKMVTLVYRNSYLFVYGLYILNITINNNTNLPI